MTCEGVTGGSYHKNQPQISGFNYGNPRKPTAEEIKKEQYQQEYDRTRKLPQKARKEGYFVNQFGVLQKAKKQGANSTHHSEGYRNSPNSVVKEADWRMPKLH